MLPKPRLEWNAVTLKRSPEAHLELAKSDSTPTPERGVEYRRYEVKKWYEKIVGAAKVTFDLNQLDPIMASEVGHVRSLLGGAIPWRGDGKEYKDVPKTYTYDKPAESEDANPLGEGMVPCTYIYFNEYGQPVERKGYITESQLEYLLRRSEDPWFWREGSW